MATARHDDPSAAAVSHAAAATSPTSGRRRARRGPRSATSAAARARATRRSARAIGAAQPDLPARAAAQPLERRRHRAAHLDRRASSGRAATASASCARSAAAVCDRVGVRAVDPDRDQPAVRRIAELGARRRLGGEEAARSRAPPRAITAGALGPIGLDDHAARALAAPGAARDLREQLERALRRRESPAGRARCRRTARRPASRPGSRGPWSPSACRPGCRPRGARPARARASTFAPVATSRSSRATRASGNALGDRVRDLLGAEALALDRPAPPHFGHASGTRCAIAAVVAAQAIAVAVIRQRHRAVRAAERVTARRAQHERREAAAVEEQDRPARRRRASRRSRRAAAPTASPRRRACTCAGRRPRRSASARARRRARVSTSRRYWPRSACA